jgi:hypothetical protein
MPRLDSMRQLEDPRFLRWLDEKHRGRKPAAEDFDPEAHPATDEERAEEWSRIKARMLIRLWHVWQEELAEQARRRTN